MMKKWRQKNKEKISEQYKKYYQKKRKWLRLRKGVNKLGNPKKIKQICKIYDISDEVANVIALDGELLDDKLKNIQENHIKTWVVKK
jgi:hypothetical protein